VIHEQQDVSSATVSWELPAAPQAEAMVPVILLTEVVPVIAPAYPVSYDPPIRISDRVVALHVFLI
jgi:hypothetical protein